MCTSLSSLRDSGRGTAVVAGGPFGSLAAADTSAGPGGQWYRFSIGCSWAPAPPCAPGCCHVMPRCALRGAALRRPRAMRAGSIFVPGSCGGTGAQAPQGNGGVTGRAQTAHRRRLPPRAPRRTWGRRSHPAAAARSVEVERARAAKRSQADREARAAVPRCRWGGQSLQGVLRGRLRRRHGGIPCVSHPGLPTPEAAWLELAMKASLATFGEHIDGRLADAGAGAVARALQSADAPSSQAAAAMQTARRTEAGLDEQRGQLEALRLELAAHAAAPPRGGGMGDAERLVARIAALGWDATEAELMQRAIEALRAAGVQDSSVSDWPPQWAGHGLAQPAMWSSAMRSTSPGRASPFAA